MKYSVEEIIEFIKDYTGSKKVYPDTNLCEHSSLFGDDFDELLERYSKKFNVDMNGYLWYFHRAEEGFGCLPGSFFFKPPDARVKQIPVTPFMLTEFANFGKWDIPYPSHKLPNKRHDVLINQIFLGVLFIFITIVLIYKYFIK